MNTHSERTVFFNRKNILEAADKLFRESGVEKVTMDCLAAEAGYSKPTLYKYFKDKDEVYYSLVYDFMKKMQDEINAIIESNDGFEKKYLLICNKIYEMAEQFPLYFEGLIGNIYVDTSAKQLPNCLANVDFVDAEVVSGNNIETRFERKPKVYNEIYSLGAQIIGSLEKVIFESQIGIDLSNANAVIFYLWSSISGIIRMIIKKPEYMALLGLNKATFANMCFEFLINGCGKNKDWL